MRFGRTFVAVLLGSSVAGAQLEMDCTRPQQARNVVGRLMLSEIEGAEDTNRAAMWEAFGRCPTGAGTDAAACRKKEQTRFEAMWEQQKRVIQDKYRKMLDNEARERERLAGQIRARTKELLDTNQLLLKVQKELISYKKGVAL